jgi:lysophospholipid acyltransferase (LPLAT)-like uncharacterized protein
MAKKKKSVWQQKAIFFLEKYLAAGFVLLLGASCKYKLLGKKQGDNVIYVFWHQNILPLLYLHRFSKSVVLISSSKDGEYISGPAEVLGYQTARGSSTRGGSSAIKKLIKLSENYSVAITPDGPKGPIHEVKDGVIYLALITKKPIIPVSIIIDKAKVLNSWDKFRIPKFFSKIEVTYGEPIFVHSKNEIEEKKIQVQEMLSK